MNVPAARNAPADSLSGSKAKRPILSNARRVSKRLGCAISLAAIFTCFLLPASSGAGHFRFGFYAIGLNDGITDVPGVLVSHVTKIEGNGRLKPGIGPVRTGATAIIPNSDPWNHKVSAATFAYNGNGEMSGTHWINESGFLETPIVLTDTLNVGRASDGVVSWMIRRYPAIGVGDDVPLPVVAECDDQALNDIQGRHVLQSDINDLLNRARPGQFARGSVGAGTGMNAFGFKAGIGSASRVVSKAQGGYTVGVLVNDNTGSAPRQLLTVDGVHVGEMLRNELLPVFPKSASFAPRGRAQDGSIIVITATDAPLDGRQLRALAKRSVLGMGRVGLTSLVSSGDLLLSFSTTYRYDRDARQNLISPQIRFIEDDDTLNALYGATVEATEAAIYDALFSAQTMTGRDGITFYGLPRARVLQMLKQRPN